MTDVLKLKIPKHVYLYKKHFKCYTILMIMQSYRQCRWCFEINNTYDPST